MIRQEEGLITPGMAEQQTRCPHCTGHPRLNGKGITMAKTEKEQKPMLNLDGKEYEIDSMTDEQKAMTNHVADLNRKIETMAFNMQQLEFGKQAFINALKSSLSAEDKDEE